MFLKKLDICSDVNKIATELNTILNTNPWTDSNQIGIKFRPGALNPWRDAVGSLNDPVTRIRLANEVDFTEWVVDNTWYVRQQIHELENNLGIKTGRVRFMNLPPRRGLSVHRDLEVRYHLVLKTNTKSFMSLSSDMNVEYPSDLPVTALCFNMPQDGHWWRVDTTQTHWVYNGGDTNRIHLVVCGV
jgi:hypothetical protein